MSLCEGLDDVNLLDSAADKLNQNVILRYQSMIINDEQHLINDDQGREIHSVPDESTCSKWIEQSRREAAISDNCQEGFTRSRKMTMKGLLQKRNTLRERRRKINSRLIRKYGTIEDLLCSSTNKVAVEEEMNQFNDLLKMLIDVRQDYNQLLDDNEREKDDWFDEIDTQACSFKRKVHCWLRETAQKTNSKPSSRSSKSISDKGSGNPRISKSSHRLRSSKDTGSSKEKEIGEWGKLAELMAEALLLQEKQMIQNEAAVMEMKERLAKAQARARAYTDIALDDFHEAEGYQQQTWQQQKDQKQFHIKEEVDFKNRISQRTESAVPPYKNTWDKFVEKGNVWKPQQALERKILDREAGQSVTELKCKLLNQQNAPELEIDTFDEDPMEFHYFLAIFHEVVEKKVDDEQGRLTRLIKFTKGEAKEMVKTCIQLPPEAGFKTVKRLLHERYGDPHRITAAYRNQIKK